MLTELKIPTNTTIEEITTSKGVYRREYVTDGKKRRDGTPYKGLYGPYWFFYRRVGDKLVQSYIGKELKFTLK